MRIDSKKLGNRKNSPKSKILKNILFLAILFVTLAIVLFGVYTLIKTPLAFANGNKNGSILAKNEQKPKIKEEILLLKGHEVRFHKSMLDDKNIIAVGTLLENSEEKYQLFVVSFDLMGNKKWELKFGGKGDDWGYDITKSPDGNYIVVGTTSSKELNVRGRYDALVLKINPDGKVLWHKIYSGPDWDRSYRIARVKDGYVFVGDNFIKGYDVTENFGEHDFWVVKISENGQIMWSKSFGGIRWDRAYGIDYDNKSDAIFVTGSSNSFTNGTNYDGYVVAYDLSGKVLWKSLLTNSRVIWPSDISSTDDAIYVCGYAFENNLEKAFIAKLSKLGEVIFIHTFGENNRINSLKAIENEDKTVIYFSGYKEMKNTKYPWAGQFIIPKDKLPSKEPTIIEYLIESEYGIYFSVFSNNEFTLFSGSTQINGKIAGFIKSMPK